MGGCRCSYKNCANTTKTRENLHFFHYPVKHKERCRQWIENAKKPQFYDLDEDQLRNKVVCETHFETSFFPNTQKKRLLQGAIPTLDGDCEVEVARLQDVQVLPANADGTIFVLDTSNMATTFKSEKVESYIYTNNGLVLPINKCDELLEDSLQPTYSHEDLDILTPRFQPETIRETLNSEQDMQSFVYVPSTKFRELQVRDENCSSSRKSPVEKKAPKSSKLSDEVFARSVGSKYVRKIKQHSKDIAILKRMVRSNTSRRPSNTTILNCLKRQLPPTLFDILSFHLNSKCVSEEQFDIFTTMYSTSPELYQILRDKHDWKLPNPEIFNGNGHK